MLPDVYCPVTAPFQHQREALEAGWDREGFGYLLEMGLGKSRVLIDNFCLLYKLERVSGLIVVAPKSVYENWTRVDDENPGELQKWLWRDMVRDCRTYTHRSGKTSSKSAVAERTAALDTTQPGARVMVVNIEALQSEEVLNTMRMFMRKHKTMMTIDESTIIKNPSAERTKACLRLASLAEYRRILAGRGSTGSLSDFYTQFEFLGPGQRLLGFSNFTTFRARYCQLREMYVGGRTIKTEIGPQNVEELATRLAKHSFRRTKKQCLDLPEKQYVPWPVTLTEEQARVYADLKKTAMAELRGAEVTTDIVMTQLMRMHQVICGHVKTDDGRILRLESNRLAEVERILEDTDEQAVIWAAYRPDADLLAARLRELYGADSVSEWHGGVKQQDRERGETEFQAGRARFMVSTSAGARGRTWTAATLVIYYSNSYDLDVREQSEDRTHRIGTVGTVTYVDLVCRGTLDEKIIAALRGKRDVVRAVLRDGPEAWI